MAGNSPKVEVASRAGAKGSERMHPTRLLVETLARLQLPLTEAGWPFGSGLPCNREDWS